MRPVLAATDARCFMLGVQPGAREIAVQLAIRSVLVSRSTSAGELKATRKLFRIALELRESLKGQGHALLPVDCLPSGFSPQPWLAEFGWNDASALVNFLERKTSSEMRDLGARLLPGMIRSLRGVDALASDAELSTRLAGLSAAGLVRNVRVRSKIHWEPISEEMVLQLEEGMEDLKTAPGLDRAGHAISADRNLPRLLMRSAWLTGMRSIELFGCQLLAFEPTLNRCDMLRQSLVHGDASLFPSSRLLRMMPAGPAVEALPDNQACGNQECPVFAILIRSAKVACTSPRLRCPIRLQYLEGMSKEDLLALGQVSRLRKLGFDKAHQQYLLASSSKLLKQTARRLFPERRDPVTLNTFRHAFIDHARMTMSVAEVAALTGHTTSDSVRWYGRRYTRQRPGRAAARWMPMPDPRRVEQIRTVWDQRGVPPTPSIEPECEPEWADPF